MRPQFVVRHRRVVALTVMTCLYSGCYSQQSIGLAVPAPETRVIAQLTDSGTVVMSSSIGSGALAVEGIVAEADPTYMKLRLLKVDQRGGVTAPWNREVVTFPRNTLTNVNTKKLDKKRSWVAAGLIVIGALLSARAFGVILGGDNPGDGTIVPS